MKEIKKGKDCNGEIITKDDYVVTDNTAEQGKITAIYDNGSVDIHISDAHQGPVIDSYDIMARQVQKVDF